MSNWTLQDDLRNILNIIADLANNNTEHAVFDHAIIAESSNLPPYEIRNYRGIKINRVDTRR